MRLELGSWIRVAKETKNKTKKNKKRNRSTPSTYYLLKRKWIFITKIDHDRLRFGYDFCLLLVFFLFVFLFTFDHQFFFLELTDMNCGGNPCGNAVPTTKHTQSAIEMKLRIFLWVLSLESFFYSNWIKRMFFKPKSFVALTRASFSLSKWMFCQILSQNYKKKKICRTRRRRKTITR